MVVPTSSVGHSGGGSAAPTIRPDPDPTILTTQQLWREIANLEARLNGKIDGIEKSIEVAHDDLVRVPTAVDKAVEQLKQLTWGQFDTHNVKFDGIATQFKERDTRIEQTSIDTKTRVEAALAAQEKAAGKQADAFTKQIDALDDKISDIRDRQITSEGTGKGRGDVWGYVAAIAGLLIALAAIFRGHI
jgi:chromosome segregation ATPase